ncbi:AfsR/SARP family transcriptional regulator [Streptomyces chattanoogensis]|uniref:AfsR/SARP family transcriptional regulator n=1 Tax=Streptomyces chattanoogensis TaxID=66876 RepID=UPI0036D008A9
MDAGILGPLKAADRGQSVRITSGQQRTLLAALLLSANTLVSQDQLVDVLWDSKPPRNAHAAMRTYVMRLRQTLGAELGARILTQAGGYLLQAEPEEIDLLHCGLLHRAAQTAVRQRDWASAARDLERALALWRGEPLVDVASQRLRERELPAIGQLRLDVLELHYEVQLALGAHQEVLRDLQAAVDRHPLHERFCAQLMTALHLSGRRSDALDAYQATRRRLAEELGIDPGQEMRQLQQQILADAVVAPSGQTDARAAPAPQDAAPERERQERPAPIVPRQLPVPASHFTGRQEELRSLDELRAGMGAIRRGAAVVTLVGTGGIGKTALAVHWAHQAAAEFPDGQLFVDLRGFDPAGDPLAPSLAVRRLLDAFEIPEERIPSEFEARCALYRSVLAERRVLLVLDNARDEEQVRPLLPAGPGCMVVVTSRQKLPGLLTGDAGLSIHVGLLSPAETRSLCERVLGQERFASAGTAADAMIELSGRIPLTTRILLASANAQPRLSMQEVIGHFKAVPSHLDRFETGDARTSVRTALIGSYRNLGSLGARLFRALGLYRGDRIALPAAAALAGLPAAEAHRALAELTRHHLMTVEGPGRYAMHDIVRDFAFELAHQDPAEERAAVRDRILTYFLRSAEAAVALADPAAVRRFEAVAPARRPDVTVEVFADAPAARQWFVTERHAMLAHLAHAREDGFAEFGWLLAERMGAFMHRSGHWQEWAYAARCAMAAAVARADLRGEALAQLQLGWASDLIDQGGRTAHPPLARALELYEQLGDPAGQARAHLRLTRYCGRRGQEAACRDHAGRALKLFRATGDRDGEAETLNALGWHCVEFDDHPTATTSLLRSLRLYQELGNRHGEADVWDSLAWAYHYAGECREARRCYLQAIELDASLDQLGSRHNQAQTLIRCGELHLTTGDLTAAAGFWRRAAAILEELGLPQAVELRDRIRSLAAGNR